MFLEDKITEHSKEKKEIRISVKEIQKNQENKEIETEKNYSA